MKRIEEGGDDMKQTHKTESRPVSAEQMLRDAANAASAARATNAQAAGGSGGRPEQVERRSGSVVDQRLGVDRRDLGAFAEKRRAGDATSRTDCQTESQSEGDLDGATSGDCHTNLERRRGPGRRRTDFMKAADEGEMSQEQFLFIMAIDAFKRVNGKTFPTWTDVLEVIRKLGYRKTMVSELKNLGANTEDWTERADAPAGVFKPATDEE